MKIDKIDHLVLTVRDIDATCEFYTRVLGMRAIVFGDNRRALVFGDCKINLHQAGNEIRPGALHPVPGSADLCLITPEPLSDLMAVLDAHKTPILEGPVARSGAVGPLVSIYLRDPDGNLIEISNQR